MRCTAWIFVLCLTLAVLANGVAAQAPANVANNMKQVNKDLEDLTKAISQLLKHPGFRGYLRSAIAQSKNREKILDLDEFLDRATKQSKMPPGLAKLKDEARKVRGKIKSSKLSDLEGLDLYIPVGAQRAKWKGGENILVAYAPLGDEKDIKQLVAYSVKDGKRVAISAAKAPQQVVIILAPEEHETHATKGRPEKVKMPAANPKPHLKGKKPEAPKGMKEPGGGNSQIGIKYLKIYKDQEPWYKGDPEIYVQLAHRQGSSCKMINRWCGPINRTNTWYYTWNTSYTCNGSLRMYFDNTYWNKTAVFIYESDGGYYKPYLYQIYSGVTCQVYRRSDDDYIDSAYIWRSAFNYNYDYYHHIGDAYLVWRKEH